MIMENPEEQEQQIEAEDAELQNEDPVNQVPDQQEDLPEINENADNIARALDADPVFTALVKFARREFTTPIILAVLSIFAFWTIIVHGNFLMYFCLQGLIFTSAIVTVKDYERPRRYGIHTHIIQPMDARPIQLMTLQSFIFMVDILRSLAWRLRYFNVKSKSILDSNPNPDAPILDQMDKFFSESISKASWMVYVKISNQIFWASLMVFLTARMLILLVMMCRTPLFRLILRFESEILISATSTILLGVLVFNHFANSSGSFPVALFLTCNLFIWVAFVLLKFTKFNDELEVSRTNDLSGILQVMSVTVCQVGVSGIIFSCWGMLENLLSYSKRYFDSDIANYLSKEKKTSLKEGDVIEFNMHLIGIIMGAVVIARFLVHYRKIKHLDEVLARAAVHNV